MTEHPILDTEFVVIDTETTGTDTANAKVVEVAALMVSPEGRLLDTFTSLVNPSELISPESSAVHHVTDDDVADAPTLADIAPVLAEFVDGRPLVAHNAPYDRAMLPLFSDHTLLCSLRLTRHLWPQAPSHKIQVLRYWRKLRHVDTFGHPPHRALADVLVTAAVLRHAFADYAALDQPLRFPDVVAYANAPISVQKMPFGEHRGKPVSDVPTRYIKWALRACTDLDPDLRWTLERVLQLRGQS